MPISEGRGRARVLALEQGTNQMLAGGGGEQLGTMGGAKINGWRKEGVRSLTAQDQQHKGVGRVTGTGLFASINTPWSQGGEGKWEGG